MGTKGQALPEALLVVLPGVGVPLSHMTKLADAVQVPYRTLFTLTFLDWPVVCHCFAM
jgi:hypothetical protein